MQPNYNELAQRQQKDYQASRDPFQYGQQVAQRRYSEMMSNLDTQRQATQQSYGDLYSQAKQRAVGGAAVGGPTLSGGMGQQQRDYVSAIEMQELGRIGTAREGASRDLFSQGQAAFSNAQLEGQQATQMRLQDQQTQLQLIQQRQQILDSDLPEEQKQAQLAALGIGGVDASSGPTNGGAFGAALSIGIPTAGIALRKGAAQVAALNTWNTVGSVAAKQTARAAALQAVKNIPVGDPTRFGAMRAAYKASMASAKAPTLGMTGKLYSKIIGGATGKLGIAKAVGSAALRFAGKAVGIYAIVSGIETVAELLGVAEGRGFSGLITEEGSNWDKFFEGVGL